MFLDLDGFKAVDDKPMPPAQFLAALAHHETLHGPTGAEGLTPAIE